MNDAYNNSLKSKIRLLSKGEVPDTPLFLPLIFSMGAQIEAINFKEFSSNPTKINKGLVELQNALDFGVITPAFSEVMEAEALGADLDWSSYPPSIKAVSFSLSREASNDDIFAQMLNSERVAAAIESTRRFKLMAAKGTLIVASLTGPATLADQLVGGSFNDLDTQLKINLLDFCGRYQAGLTRLCGEAGAQVIILHETQAGNVAVDLRDAWISSLKPIVNVAKFHRCLVAIVPPSVENTVLENILAEKVSGAIWCPPLEMITSDRLPQTLGVSIPANPAQWQPFPPGAGLVVTRGEVPPDFRILDLKAAIERQIATTMLDGSVQ